MHDLKGWVYEKLGELPILFIDSDRSKRYPKRSEFQDQGIAFLNAESISSGRFDRTKVNHIPYEKYEEIKKGRVKNGDIVLTMRGNGVGDAALIFGEGILGLINAQMLILRPNDETINSKFLYYGFISPQFKCELSNFVSGSAQPQLTMTHLRHVPFRVPPLPEQKAIAHILGSLDDKIELNRQMNETLEAMAQALFKSWFVDFDPVIDNALAAGNAIPDEFAERAKQRKAIEKKDNADIQSLFPDEFEFTEEMGWIPKGWASGTIAGISFVKGGYAFKSKDFTDTGFPVIKIKNINSDRTVNTSDVQFIPNEIAKKAESFWLKTGDLMMAMTGATVGKFGLLVAENKKAYLLNQRVAKFSPISSVSDKIWFIYCFLNQKSTIDYIVNIAEGSAQPNISADSIMATQLVKPSNELINIFNETVDSNLNKMLMNREECLTLEKLRDTLLPKLISGELRIQDAEALVDEVL